MNTELEINEIPTGSCMTMRLIDASRYLSTLTVANALLEITPPGFTCPVVFEVEKDFNRTFNSATLEIAASASYNDLVPLPDGVYEIKYSVNPNAKIYVEYSLLRNCRLTKQYSAAICQLFQDRSKICKKEFEDRRRELIWIKELIDASKYMVEELQDPEEGLNLYNEAAKLVSKINAETIC